MQDDMQEHLEPWDRDQNSKIEAQYLALYAELAATYGARREGGPPTTVGLVISDTIDGVIHNPARRGVLRDAQIRQQLVRMLHLYLTS